MSQEKLSSAPSLINPAVIGVVTVVGVSLAALIGWRIYSSQSTPETPPPTAIVAATATPITPPHTATTTTDVSSPTPIDSPTTVPTTEEPVTETPTEVPATSTPTPTATVPPPPPTDPPTATDTPIPPTEESQADTIDPPIVIEVCIQNDDAADVKITIDVAGEARVADPLDTGCVDIEFEGDDQGKSGQLEVEAEGFETYTDPIAIANQSYPVTLEESPPTPSSPPVATIIFVQSQGINHSLGAVSSNGNLIKGPGDLLREAGAPAWSPDGNSFAVFLEPDNGIGSEGVWVFDQNGQNPRQVINVNHIKNISWSPNGDKIAYEFNDIDNPQLGAKVWVVHALDGSSDTPNFQGEQPTWSPDGQKLVAKMCVPDCGLWLVNIDGSTVQRLTTESTDSFPSWSPDGAYLSFSSRRDGDWEIYIQPLTGMAPAGDAIRLTQEVGDDITPVFGPGSQVIYYRRTNDGLNWSLYSIHVDRRSPTLLFEGIGASNDWGLARPAVK